MTSLRALSPGGPFDRASLLDAFTRTLEAMVEQLRSDAFDGADWQERQLTNGRLVRLLGHDGREQVVHALGVDPATGALNVVDETGGGARRAVVSGEIHHLRLDGSV
jgi:biotin-(acetyl-CoA carboxylase) ligase